MRILILGASGMLGSAIFRLLSKGKGNHVYGSIRAFHAATWFADYQHKNLITGVDVENYESLIRAFNLAKPEIVINCIGLVKQLAEAENPLNAIPLNALLPHRLAALCEICNARLVHISTDCVFSGSKGMYTEEDVSDAQDLYGRSKYLGEVDYPHAITLRTSIIGHELGKTQRGLVEWFLCQADTINGYKKAIFSGLPTVEMARIIRDYVIPNADLHGVYHVSSAPISKFDLLVLIAKIYGKKIKIVPDEQFCIDRSLDSKRFCHATGYQPGNWVDLLNEMHKFN